MLHISTIRVTLYFFLSSLSLLLLKIDFLSFKSIQIILVVIYVIMFLFEFKVAKHRFFVLPPAVFMLFSFINNFISGILYLEYGIGEMPYFNGNPESIVMGTWYTLVASQVLWISFYLIPNFKIRFFKKAEIKGVSKTLIFLLVGISLLAFFIGIKLNIYGYVAAHEKVKFLSYMRVAVSLGLLAIIFLAVYHYDYSNSRKVLYGLIVLYFFVGVAFGSKSTSVLPVFLLIISLYMTKRKIKIYHLLIGILSIVLAYKIIEPFRTYYHSKGVYYNVEKISEFSQLFIDSYKYSSDTANTNFGISFVERQSYVVPLAMTIQYADSNDYYASEEWKNLALSPFYAIIPRFLWESKPLANFGSWASVNIFSLAETTNIGITPQGYAYLVARFAGIIIFFALAGTIQKIMFNAFYLNPCYISFYIFMYLDIGYPSVVPWTFVAGTIKSVVFLLPIIIVLVYTKMGRSSPIQA